MRLIGAALFGVMLVIPEVVVAQNGTSVDLVGTWENTVGVMGRMSDGTDSVEDRRVPRVTNVYVFRADSTYTHTVDPAEGYQTRPGGPQQPITVKGRWTVRRDTLVLSPDPLSRAPLPVTQAFALRGDLLFFDRVDTTSSRVAELAFRRTDGRSGGLLGTWLVDTTTGTRDPYGLPYCLHTFDADSTYSVACSNDASMLGKSVTKETPGLMRTGVQWRVISDTLFGPFSFGDHRNIIYRKPPTFVVRDDQLLLYSVPTVYRRVRSGTP